MKILVADDEVHARTRIKSLVEEIDSDFEVVGEVRHGVEAVELSWDLKPDLVLLDIRMPLLDGIEAARELGKIDRPPAIVFTTAYDQHALQAFEANAIDYLLKPIRKEKLENSLRKAKIVSQSQYQQLSSSVFPKPLPRNQLCIPYRGELKLISVDSIFYFQADHKYTVVRTLEQEYLIEESLKVLENEFKEFYIRIHRNALAARKHLAGLRKTKAGRIFVNFVGISDQLEVSRRQLSELRALLRNGK